MLTEIWSDTFNNPTQRLFWVYILSSVLIAVLFTLYQLITSSAADKAEVFTKNRLKQQYLTLKHYVLHPSAILDYKYFFIGTLIKVLLIAPLLISAKTVAIIVFKYLSPIIGMPITSLSYEFITLLYTISLFLVSDFSRYILHRFLHTNKYLWQFHKVHHSAAVLNPLSFYRVHPVENCLFGLRYALSVGLVTGIFLSLFGPRISLWTIVGVNGFLFVFSVLGTHLRHSHLFIRYPQALESLFISPAMHQIHHYKGYLRYNYGGYLAIWDKFFGTWMSAHHVTPGQALGFSHQEMQRYQSVYQLLFQPFISLKQLLLFKLNPKKGENHVDYQTRTK